MSKKTARIIIWVSALVIIAALAGWYFFFLRGSLDFFGAETRGLREFFPFGQREGGEGTNKGEDGEGGNIDGSSGEEIPILRKISDEPVAGATAFEAEALGTTKIKYVERATGHIYETTTTSLEKSRVSNTTVPKVYEAVWVENGSAVILRYLAEAGETILSFYGAVVPKEGGDSGDAGELRGVFLQQGILELVASADPAQILYIEKNEAGARGIIAKPDGSKKEEFFSSAITEWLMGNPGKDTLLLATKPSFRAPGFAYTVDKKTGAMDKLIGNIAGLTIFGSPDGKKILYSQSAGATLRVALYDLKGKTERTIPVVTLPEKCAWSSIDTAVIFCGVPTAGPYGELPDAWYQGRLSFTDDIWKINLETGATDFLISPHNTLQGEPIDVFKPFLDEKEKNLIFINKKDLSLWSLKLNQ